jgi:3,5-epimerase/4-reductase
MKSIVFGKGFLGTRIAGALGYDLTDTNPLNLSELQGFLDFRQPKVVINTIGKTGRPNIDWCETHREETMLSNVSAAINLGIECSKKGIYSVYLGSGCIYQGDNGGNGFSEEDFPNFYGPQFYAKTKILAEKALLEFPGLILRLRMPIDDRPHERNLINKLLTYPTVVDIKNSMTTVPHMIGAVSRLIEKREEGIYNLVNPGLISPLEILQLYKEIVDESFQPKLMSPNELDSVTKGKRTNCMLNTNKLKSKGIELPEIHEAVRECLLKYKEVKK